MTASVNGTQIGHDTLASMAFSWGEMIAYASRGTWVMPGSVLGSGTCGGGCLAELWGRQGRDAHPPAPWNRTKSLALRSTGSLTGPVRGYSTTL